MSDVCSRICHVSFNSPWLIPTKRPRRWRRRMILSRRVSSRTTRLLKKARAWGYATLGDWHDCLLRYKRSIAQRIVPPVREDCVALNCFLLKCHTSGSGLHVRRTYELQAMSDGYKRGMQEISNIGDVEVRPLRIQTVLAKLRQS